MTKLKSLIISKSKSEYITPTKRTLPIINWRNIWVAVRNYYELNSIDYAVDVDIRHTIKREVNKQLRNWK